MAPGAGVPVEEANSAAGSAHLGSGGVMSQRENGGRWTPETGSSSPLPFFHLLERLKTTKREGWRRFGINHGESIADHMYRMSIITMLCPPELAARLDLARCTKMALVHDMAESLVGDITPVDGVSKVEKSRRETETMDYMCTSLLGLVHGGSTGQDLRAVWQEYEDDLTLEAHFVHDVDKLELLLQMLEYERLGEGHVDLGEFSHVAGRIQLPEVQAWAAGLLDERRSFWTGLKSVVVGEGAQPNSEHKPSKLLQSQQDEYYGGAATSVAGTK